MKIVFIRAYDFPWGGPSQNRALSICRGLIEQNNQVEVHVFAPAKLDIHSNHLKYQEYKSIPIYNHAWKYCLANNKLKKIKGIIAGMISTCIALIKSYNTNRIDCIFINTEKTVYALPFYLFAKIIRADFGRELNEFPSFVLLPNKYNKLQIAFQKLINYRWFDVFLIMTKTLTEFYKPLMRSNAKVLLLPMSVDFDRFTHPVSNLAENDEIVYCGDMSQSKDGVVNLIQSYKLISDKFPKLKLRLIGKNSDHLYMKYIQELVIQLDMSNQIILEGYINPEKVPEYLYAARLLVLSRPNNIQAQGGFPTKLGEYLATGIPVVVTDVGEISEFLQDEVSAFLVVPDNVQAFADTMVKALNDNNLSQSVGTKGRETALKYFSHKAQGKLISTFLSKK